MDASVGDEVLVGSDQSGLPGRVGTVVSSRAAGGRIRYVVHWLVGDYDAVIVPGERTKVQVRQRAHAGTPGSRPAGPKVPSSPPFGLWAAAGGEREAGQRGQP